MNFALAGLAVTSMYVVLFICIMYKFFGADAVAAVRRWRVRWVKGMQ